MIYNGFDPGVLALLAGEDRAVTQGDENAGSDPGPGEGLLIFVAAGVLLAGAILLGGIAL